MAIGKLGGTRSKVSGSVGTEIYTIRRNADGDLIQIVSEKPETRTDTLTEAKAMQRMRMSIVMSHQPLLHDFMAAAFQDIPEGTLSVQNFVRQNVLLLQQEGNQGYPPYFRWWYRLYGDTNIYPEPLLITDGTWTAPLDSIGYSENNGYTAVGISTPQYFERMTIAQYMDKWNFHKGEYMIYLFFVCAWNNRAAAYQYVRINWREDVDVSQILQDADMNSLFEQAGTFSVECSTVPADRYDFTGLFFNSQRIEKLYGIMAYGALQVVWRNGKRLLSKCRLRTNIRNEYHGLTRYTIKDVYPSWYTDRL